MASATEHFGEVTQMPSIWPKVSMVFGSACDDDDRGIGLCHALILAQLLQPAVAPIAGALQFPKDFAARLPERSCDELNRVAAELALRHGRDRVVRKARPKQRLKLQFLHLALKLLRALLRLAFQLFDLFLHRKDRLLTLLDLEPKRLLCLRFRALLNFGLRLQHALFERQVELPFFFGKLALHADGVRLRLLRLGEFRLALLEGLGQLFELLILVIEVDRDSGPRLPGLLLRELLALPLQPLGKLRLHGFLGLFHRGLLRPDRGFPLRDFGLFRAQLLVAFAPYGFDKRSGQSFRELDLSPAVWANDRRFQAQSLPSHCAEA